MLLLPPLLYIYPMLLINEQGKPKTLKIFKRRTQNLEDGGRERSPNSKGETGQSRLRGEKPNPIS